MKTTVVELRESMAATLSGAENETTRQLTAVYAEINREHETAMSRDNMPEEITILTKLDLTAQAQEDLTRDGFTVELMPYTKSELNPDLYRISWSY